jgi:hypothetical protein
MNANPLAVAIARYIDEIQVHIGIRFSVMDVLTALEQVRHAVTEEHIAKSERDRLAQQAKK